MATDCSENEVESLAHLIPVGDRLNSRGHGPRKVIAPAPLTLKGSMTYGTEFAPQGLRQSPHMRPLQGRSMAGAFPGALPLAIFFRPCRAENTLNPRPPSLGNNQSDTQGVASQNWGQGAYPAPYR